MRKQRRMFGQTLADFQLTQARLGEMAALIDGAALLTYRAAWLRDVAEASGADAPQAARERSVAAAMAKMCATENAQRVIDMALQMHGGLGVHGRQQGREPVPRHPFAAHLRGRDRGAAADHRQGGAAGREA